jgi:hypothetical protein
MKEENKNELKSLAMMLIPLAVVVTVLVLVVKKLPTQN